ncbi:sulfatase-like hydrolase/transferase [Flammeovirgaceae bacterium SG7u.111]|nr:sulfatase-like hydrolase/transferase [Flammeovirgaceae bacterium SG7u.132]WPO37193.1 sulfatase-like hydrolase/transferase [Flammeovirgaceae bacterium SG7u.111]
MKRHILTTILLVISTYAFAQPNIILIESDDQSNVAVGAFGFGEMHTPNIDKLAKEGVYFTSAHNMGCWSPAVCIPSRTMLFNGTTIWKASKITAKKVPGASLTERLSAEGYTTYFTGKWHALGKRPQDTFDHVGHILPGQLKTYYTEEGHLTDVVGDEAVEFINQAAKEDNPFFLYVAFNAPHVPRQTEQKYYDMYPTSKIKLPPSVKDGEPLHPHIKYNYTSDPIRAKSMKERYQQNNAMVTHMDERVGDIIAALKKSGKYENSIIVFMSDHGISFGENGVAGKVCLYNVSATAPLIVCGPGIPSDIKLPQRVYLQDIYPTLLDLVGAEKPDYIDFKSLSPLIKQKTNKSPYASIYLAMFTDQRGIILNDHKLIMYPDGKAAELYNVTEDPWETTNLITQTGNEKLLKKLGKEFVAWQKETGDSLDLKPIFPEIFE